MRIEQFLELVQRNPLAGLTRAVAGRAGQVTLILLAYGVDALSCWQIGLAVTIVTCTENLDLYLHKPPFLGLKQKARHGWASERAAPAGRMV